jgi:hypothetical protein
MRISAGVEWLRQPSYWVSTPRQTRSVAIAWSNTRLLHNVRASALGPSAVKEPSWRRPQVHGRRIFSRSARNSPSNAPTVARREGPRRPRVPPPRLEGRGPAARRYPHRDSDIWPPLVTGTSPFAPAHGPLVFQVGRPLIGGAGSADHAWWRRRSNRPPPLRTAGATVDRARGHRGSAARPPAIGGRGAGVPVLGVSTVFHMLAAHSSGGPPAGERASRECYDVFRPNEQDGHLCGADLNPSVRWQCFRVRS